MSSGQNSPKSRFIRKPSTRSWEVMNPSPLVSKMRKASTRLKSDFRAKSIFADSMSLSTKIISLSVFASSFYSTLSRHVFDFLWEWLAWRCSIFWLGLREIYLLISSSLWIDRLRGDEWFMSIESPRRGLTLIGLPPWAAYSSLLAHDGEAKFSYNLGGDLCQFLGDLYPFLLVLGYSLTWTA